MSPTTSVMTSTALLRRPCSWSHRLPRRCQLIVRAEAKRDDLVNEDLLAKLKAAEEEAQRLKRELAAAKVEAGVAEAQAPPQAVRRIDSGDLRRETLFTTESKQRNWLNESDVNFFTGGGPSELGMGGGASTEEEGAIVKRRLLIGLGVTAALGAFALVPTEKLAAPPSRPLFFYLVPLIRVQALLQEAEASVPEGDYEQLRSIIARIQSSPNNMQDNLRSAAASLPDSRQAAAAEAVGREVYEYVEQIDYNRYFDARTQGGKAQQQYYQFSLQAAKAAQVKLREFLALMPREQLQAALQQVNSSPF